MRIPKLTLFFLLPLCMALIGVSGVLLYWTVTKQESYREEAVHQGQLITLSVDGEEGHPADLDGSKRIAELQAPHMDAIPPAAAADSKPASDATPPTAKSKQPPVPLAAPPVAPPPAPAPATSAPIATAPPPPAKAPAVTETATGAPIAAPSPAVSAPSAPPLVLDAATLLKPKVAIMVVGLGLRQASIDLAMTLPAEVSLGFSPYGSFTTSATKNAQGKGHEIYMHIPLELTSNAKEDAGPFALLTSLSPEKNMARLDYMLSNLIAPRGVYILGEEVFTSSLDQSQRLLEELKRRNLLLVVGDLGGADFASLARSIAVPTEVNRVWLDDVLIESTIQKNLDGLSDMAKKYNGVVVMARPYPMTIRLLQKWVDDMADSDIAIVPVSVLEQVHRIPPVPSTPSSGENSPREGH